MTSQVSNPNDSLEWVNGLISRLDDCLNDGLSNLANIFMLAERNQRSADNPIPSTPSTVRGKRSRNIECSVKKQKKTEILPVRRSERKQTILPTTEAILEDPVSKFKTPAKLAYAAKLVKASKADPTKIPLFTTPSIPNAVRKSQRKQTILVSTSNTEEAADTFEEQKYLLNDAVQKNSGKKRITRQRNVAKSLKENSISEKRSHKVLLTAKSNIQPKRRKGTKIKEEAISDNQEDIQAEPLALPPPSSSSTATPITRISKRKPGRASVKETRKSLLPEESAKSSFTVTPIKQQQSMDTIPLTEKESEPVAKSIRKKIVKTDLDTAANDFESWKTSFLKSQSIKPTFQFSDDRVESPVPTNRPSPEVKVDIAPKELDNIISAEPELQEIVTPIAEEKIAKVDSSLEIQSPIKPLESAIIVPKLHAPLPECYVESPLTKAKRIDAQNTWREKQLKSYLPIHPPSFPKPKEVQIEANPAVREDIWSPVPIFDQKEVLVKRVESRISITDETVKVPIMPVDKEVVESLVACSIENEPPPESINFDLEMVVQKTIQEEIERKSIGKDADCPTQFLELDNLSQSQSNSNNSLLPVRIATTVVPPDHQFGVANAENKSQMIPNAKEPQRTAEEEIRRQRLEARQEKAFERKKELLRKAMGSKKASIVSKDSTAKSLTNSTTLQSLHPPSNTSALHKTALLNSALNVAAGTKASMKENQTQNSKPVISPKKEVSQKGPPSSPQLPTISSSDAEADESDEEDEAKKKKAASEALSKANHPDTRPRWAQTPNLVEALQSQQQRQLRPEDIFGHVQPVKLEGILIKSIYYSNL